MSWQKYDLVFQLLTPLHIGWRKTSNLQQTRGYVTGKVFWAALTARLTREAGQGASGKAYQTIGQQIQNNFRFTYLYPAVAKDKDKPVKRPNEVCCRYPWEAAFDYLFLSSHASAALDYDSQSAADGLLHETEFVAPHTRTGHPVYLTGTLYTKTHLPPPLDKWQAVLNKLQFGGERGYGWGRVRLVNKLEKEAVDGDPTGMPTENGRITAHLIAQKSTNITGPIEPLIGWERNNDKNRTANWQLSQQANICYAPGAVVVSKQTFTIAANGLWQLRNW